MSFITVPLVDEHGDVGPGGAFRDPPDVVAAGEVGDEDLDRGAGLREFGGELLQPVAAASDDHHRVHVPGAS